MPTAALPFSHAAGSTQAAMMRRKRAMKAGSVSTLARYCQHSRALISASPKRYSTVRVCSKDGAATHQVEQHTSVAPTSARRRATRVAAGPSACRHTVTLPRRPSHAPAHLHVDGCGGGVGEEQREEEHGVGRGEEAGGQGARHQQGHQRGLHDELGAQHAQRDATGQARRPAHGPAHGKKSGQEGVG